MKSEIHNVNNSNSMKFCDSLPKFEVVIFNLFSDIKNIHKQSRGPPKATRRRANEPGDPKLQDA